MRDWTHPGVRMALAIALASVAGVAAAQRFVWPPTGSTQAAPRPETPAASAEDDWDRVAPTSAQTAAMPAMRVAPAARPSDAPIDWRILDNPNGPDTALFFDPVRRVFAVYHVDSASGQIMLKSVRSLAADLQLEQYDTSKPGPRDIQQMLDEAR